MTIPHDEYYDIAIKRIQGYKDSVTKAQEYDLILYMMEEDDLIVIERLLQLAMKGLEDDKTRTK